MQCKWHVSPGTYGYSDLVKPEFINANARSLLQRARDAHTTLAFAAGSVFNIKSGRALELEQRTIGRSVWAADDVPADPDWPTLDPTVIEMKPDVPDIAVAIGITHDITGDVRQYVEDQLPSVGRLLVLQPSTGSGSQVAAAERHAFDLAQSAKEGVTAATAHR